MTNVKVMPAPVEDYKKLIEQDFPDFKVTNIKYLGSGWDNAAMLVNGQYVFRFPREIFSAGDALNSKDIEKEVNILNYLKGKVSFAVPEPTFTVPHNRYFGYKLIAGMLWDQVDPAVQFSDDFLDSWVRIRSELSKSISVNEAPNLKIPHYRTGRNERLVQQYLDDENADLRVQQMAREATRYVLEHLSDTANWYFIHEDLQMSNCMVDPSEQKITGVIDFGDAEVGPIEADFYFWSKFGRDKLELAAKAQEEYDGTKIDVRLAEAMHQFYIVADYQDFTNRGFMESAQHKWRQIENYL